MTKVAIVDDHSVVRFGIKYVLQLDKSLELVGTGANAEEALSLCESVKPDVLLMDVRMPGKDGVTALREVLEKFPGQKVVMLTTSDTEEDVFQSIKAGAKGYVLKDSDPERIVEAVRTVAGGGSYFPPEIASIYDVRKEMKSLSPREHEILSMMAKGLSNVDIANVLGISPNSVKMHVKHTFEKLEVEDRAEAVSAAYHRGILAG